MAHTRGPWTLGDAEGFWNGNNCCIMANDPDVGPVVVADIVHSSAVEETENLELICAAPDLLAACESVLKTLQTEDDYRKLIATMDDDLDNYKPLFKDDIRLLQAAIAKAKGE